MLRINTYMNKNYILISRNFMLVRLTSWIRASPTNYNYTHVRLKKNDIHTSVILNNDCATFSFL